MIFWPCLWPEIWHDHNFVRKHTEVVLVMPEIRHQPILLVYVTNESKETQRKWQRNNNKMAVEEAVARQRERAQVDHFVLRI